MTEASAEPLVQLQTRIQRRMRLRLSSCDVAGPFADEGHPVQRPRITGRIVANLFQRNRGHRVAEKFDLTEQALVLLFEGPGAPPKGIGERVRERRCRATPPRW